MSNLSSMHSSKSNKKHFNEITDNCITPSVSNMQQKMQTSEIKRNNFNFTDTSKKYVKKESSTDTPKKYVKNNSSQIISKTSQPRKLIFNVESPSALLRQRLAFANIETFEENEKKTNKNISSRIPYNELLKGIHMYAEVRDGEDNRSAGIKSILRSMGATVHDNLIKKVTHVIFRQGLTRTYKKAINLKVHLLSILWVEAVRNAGHLVPESLYPASGLEEYSCPIASKKYQRIKSIQPDYDKSRQKELERQVRRSFYRASKSNPINELTTSNTPQKKEQKEKSFQLNCDIDQKNEKYKGRKLSYQTQLTDFTNKLTKNIISSEEKCVDQIYVKYDDVKMTKDNILSNYGKIQNTESSTLQSDIQTDHTNVTDSFNIKTLKIRKSIRLINKNKCLKENTLK